MQEKKFDYNQLIGFVLMTAVFIGYLWYTQPSEEELAQQKQEQLEKQKQDSLQAIAQKQKNNTPTPTALDTLNLGNDSTAAPLQANTWEWENDKLKVAFSTRGGQLSHVELKGYNAYDAQAKDHHKPLLMMANESASMGIKFTDSEGRITDLSKSLFEVQETQQDSLTLLTFTKNLPGGYVKYTYTLGNGYDIGFDISTQGYQNFAQSGADFSFDMKAYSQEKGKSWEQRTTDVHYSLNNGDDQDYTSSDFEADEDEAVDWVAFKQQFFTSILKKENQFQNIKLNVEQPENDSIFSKYFSLSAPLSNNTQDINASFTWHFLPLEYNLLSEYDQDFEDIIPFGWGLFGWINEWIILPVFRFMASWGIQLGWVIALLTIFIKLITSPIMYRQYRQSAMMRVLKPEMEEINKKYKGQENAMKRQQANMELYRKAGVNPLAGCLPALLQLPIFYALFNFFPNVIDLRGVSFLWAEDLTAYDAILPLPFDIPFYGAHVSLFALMYVVTMVVYFRMSGNMMNTPQQEGMPDMRFIMYLMPVMFIFFLNSYASGLSWYYFVSNAINIGLVFVIKNYMINEDKIHAKIEENKQKKPKKKGKWAQKLEQAMKQAQEQQNAQKKRKK